MGMAIGDPEDIVNFSNALESYLNTIGEETDRLNAAFSQLGETWQDRQRQSFEETYGQLQAALSGFKENAAQQIPHLRAMAEDLRAYLAR